MIDGRAVQRALSARGFDIGPIDGILNPRSYGTLLDYAAGRKLGAMGDAMRSRRLARSPPTT